MARNEFTTKTKRQAYVRCGGKCQKCGLAFDNKTKPEYDHIIMDAWSGDNSLANCQVLCSSCHKEKTAKDVANNAKAKRLEDARIGIKHKGSFKRGKNKAEREIKPLPPKRGGIAAQFISKD